MKGCRDSNHDAEILILVDYWSSGVDYSGSDRPAGIFIWSFTDGNLEVVMKSNAVNFRFVLMVEILC